MATATTERGWCLDNTKSNRDLVAKLKLDTVRMKVRVATEDWDPDDGEDADEDYAPEPRYVIALLGEGHEVRKKVKEAGFDFLEAGSTSCQGMKLAALVNQKEADDEAKKLAAKPKPELSADLKKRYADMCMKRFDEAKEEKAEVLNALEGQIKQLRNRLTTALRDYNLKKAKTAHVSKDDYRKRLENEIDKIYQMSKVKKVTISKDGTLSVTTDILYCTNSATGLEHEIGAFRIEVRGLGEDYFSEEDSLLFHNLTRKTNAMEEEMQAPHVFSDGVACLGSLEDVLPDLYSEYECAAIVMLAIQFIETANVDDDAGRYITAWPLSSRSKQARLKAQPVTYEKKR